MAAAVPCAQLAALPSLTGRQQCRLRDPFPQSFTWLLFLCRLTQRPELRACARVVAILQPSRKRGAVVGLVREDPMGKALMLMPCDPRMPMCLLRFSELPAELKASLKVSLPAPEIGAEGETKPIEGHAEVDLRSAADCLSWGDLA